MEEELKCPICKQLYSNPVLLPCYHAVCLNCAVQIQQAVPSNGGGGHTILHNGQNGVHSHASGVNFHGHSHHILVTTTATVHSPSPSVLNSGSLPGQGSDNEDGSDQVSILSETDSGVVVCGSTSSGVSSSSNCSRPGSYIGTPNFHTALFPPIQSRAYCCSCPVCHKIVYFDENGAQNLPKYRIMQSIVDKFVESRNLGTKCQLCEKNPKNATVMCEQCEIFYCEQCREACHPLRGPLAKHSLVDPSQGKESLKLKAGPVEYRCPDHSNEALSMYCMMCKAPVCGSCRKDGKHFDHDVQPIQIMSKAQKELTVFRSSFELKTCVKPYKTHYRFSSSWTRSASGANLFGTPIPKTNFV